MYSINKSGQETYESQFGTILEALNGRVLATGAPLEGNLFYFNHAQNISVSSPDPRRKHKRKNFVSVIRGKSTLLEIGFNAGHSALLALSANPDLRYVGIDIAKNAYTSNCGALMKEQFGERFQLIEGDSREVLPHVQYFMEDVAPDVFHVDGGHWLGIAVSDIAGCVSIARARGVAAEIIVDDYAADFIQAAVQKFVDAKHVVDLQGSYEWEGRENFIGRVVLPGTAL